MTRDEVDLVRHVIARQIVEFEIRRDTKHGHPQVYYMPKGDGGGKFEVAGINDRYHPHEAAELARLIADRRYKEVEDRAAEYIRAYTDAAALWTSNLGVEAFLRDCIFNRGARGAVYILQLALGVTADGIIGPVTRGAMARGSAAPRQLIPRLRLAREVYERRHRDERSKFWKGLVKRWDKVVELSLRYVSMETK